MKKLDQRWSKLNTKIDSLAAYTEAAWSISRFLFKQILQQLWYRRVNTIRRELIESGKIIQRWSNATIEDHNLTHAVKDQNKIHLFLIVLLSIDLKWYMESSLGFCFSNDHDIWMGHRKAWLAAFIGSVPKNVILLFALLSIFGSTVNVSCF